MRKLSADEVASLFRERDEIAERERGRELPPDLQKLAERVFGVEPYAERARAAAIALEDPEPQSLVDALERLTVALVALRAAFVPDPPSEGRLGREILLRILERIASAANAALIVPRGEISTEAPELLLNPTFWLGIEGLREEALSGDKVASDRLDRVLSVLRVPKRRTEAGRAKAVAERSEAARELLRDSEFMASPLARLAVEIARDGKRGPVPLRAAELLVNDAPALVRIRRLEAVGKRLDAKTLRAELASRALALEGRRKRAAKRKRAKTRGPK